MSNPEGILEPTVQATQASEAPVENAESDVSPQEGLAAEEQVAKNASQPSQLATEQIGVEGAPVKSAVDEKESSPADAEQQAAPTATEPVTTTSGEPATDAVVESAGEPVAAVQPEAGEAAVQEVQEVKGEAPLTPKRIANIVASPAKRAKVAEQ